MRIEVGGNTHVGRVRQNNEDAFQIERSLNLYVLSDGIGGEEQGEVASALAVDTVVKHCLEAENHRAAPNGMRAADIDAFAKWLQEQGGIAKQAAASGAAPAPASP